MLPRGGAAEAIEQANAAYRRDAAAGEAAAAAAAAAARGAAGAAAAARAQLSEGMARLRAASRMPQLRGLLAARALLDMSVMFVHSTFGDYTRLKFGWDAKHAGYGMAFTGLLSVLSDLVLLPALLRSRKASGASELPTVLFGGGVAACGLLLVSLAATVRGFLGGLAALTVGVTLCRSAFNTIVINQAAADQTGVVSGAIDAVESFCRVAAPLAGGVLLQSVSLEGPPRAGAVLCVCGVAAFLEAAPPTLKKGWLRGGREKQKDE